jgi:hypothetical protein
MTRTFAFDRKTGQLVNCCGASVNGDKTVRQTGLVGYVFPMGTQKQTYQVFDTTLKKTMPFVYSGTANVHGIQAYEFVENVPPTQTGSVTLPGSFVKSTAASVTLGEYDAEHLIYYVDPETGALVDVNEQQSTTLSTSATAPPALVAFDAELIATPASVTQIVALDNNGRNELSLLQTVLPLVFGIVGAVALIVGVFLSRRRNGDAVAVELDDVSREAVPADSEQSEGAPRGRHAAELAGVVPGFDEDATDAAEGEGTDPAGPPSS